MMLSVGKIFWLVIILIAVWYLFKIIEKRKLNLDNNTQKNDKDADESEPSLCSLEAKMRGEVCESCQ